MKRIYIILMVLLCVAKNGYSQTQYQNYLIDLKGSAAATIDGSTYVIQYILPNGTSLSNGKIRVYHPTDYYSLCTNSLRTDSYNLFCTSNNFNRVEVTDNYGNTFSEFTQTSPITETFNVQQAYTTHTEALLTNGFTSLAPFPVTNVPADIQATYCQPTASIQSNDPDISNLAHQLTADCTKMQDAVWRIAQWTFGHIFSLASTNDNNDMSASQVFHRIPISGNCAGKTNLTIAMLRSVGIPARYVSGVILPYPYHIQFYSNSLPGGDGGPGSHAVYEVYYPDKSNWVIADSQSSLNFCSTHFVSHVIVPDAKNIYYLSQNFICNGIPPEILSNDMCGSISSFTNNYVADGNYTTFQS